jgi:hypothetical protein
VLSDEQLQLRYSSLNPQLQAACAEDEVVLKKCDDDDAGGSSGGGAGGRALDIYSCLKENVGQVKLPECRKEIQRVMEKQVGEWVGDWMNT